MFILCSCGMRMHWLSLPHGRAHGCLSLHCWEQDGGIFILLEKGRCQSTSYACCAFTRFLTQCHNLVFHSILLKFIYFFKSVSYLLYFCDPSSSSQQICIYLSELFLRLLNLRLLLWQWRQVKGKRPLLTVIKFVLFLYLRKIDY